jgi:hypothetical protein
MASLKVFQKGDSSVRKMTNCIRDGWVGFLFASQLVSVTLTLYLVYITTVSVTQTM